MVCPIHIICGLRHKYCILDSWWRKDVQSYMQLQKLLAYYICKWIIVYLGYKVGRLMMRWVGGQQHSSATEKVSWLQITGGWHLFYPIMMRHINKICKYKCDYAAKWKVISSILAQVIKWYIMYLCFSAVKPGSLLIDTSTIEPAVAKEVGELVQSKGAVFLDAPVSGGAKSLFLLTSVTL